MSKKKRVNPLDSITKYFKEVKAELKKVVWPTFGQIKNNTVIVLISLILVGAIIWVLDLGFAATLGKVVEQAPNPQNDIIPDENTFPIGDDAEQLPELPPQYEDEAAEGQQNEQ